LQIRSRARSSRRIAVGHATGGLAAPVQPPDRPRLCPLGDGSETLVAHATVVFATRLR